MSDEARKTEMNRLKQVIITAINPVEGMPETERKKIIEACRNSLKKLLAKGEDLDQFLND